MLDVLVVLGKDFLFDTLTETILAHKCDNFGRVFFLGIDPTNHLIHASGSYPSSRAILCLHHGLANRRTGLLDLRDHGGIVKDTARHLTMSTAQPQDKVERGFFLNVVVAQGTSIFELLAGKNQALLIGWNALLVLNLGLDIIDRVGRFDVQRDGLARQRLDENLIMVVGEMTRFVRYSTIDTVSFLLQKQYLVVAEQAVAAPTRDTPLVRLPMRTARMQERGRAIVLPAWCLCSCCCKLFL